MVTYDLNGITENSTSVSGGIKTAHVSTLLGAQVDTAGTGTDYEFDGSIVYPKIVVGGIVKRHNFLPLFKEGE